MYPHVLYASLRLSMCRTAHKVLIITQYPWLSEKEVGDLWANPVILLSGMRFALTRPDDLADPEYKSRQHTGRSAQYINI